MSRIICLKKIKRLLRQPQVTGRLYGTRESSQVALVVKNPPANAGDVKDAGLIPGSGRSPGGGHGNPPQYSYLENPHGQRSLAGYSPWGRKELDMTERLSTAQHLLIH